ncbi:MULTISPECIES: hypothetical protein [unclassified Streptomyces]|uniref:hypothetical protein n=1 Tax=unclassified Streptomyces TaxID=2593676 RepID=UPI003803DED2
MHWRTTGLALFLTLTSVLPVACAAREGTGGQPPRHPTAAPLWTQAAGMSLELPFDAYKWTPREDWSLERARRVLLEHCVRAAGVDFTMPVTTAREAPAAGYDNSRRYGVTDERVAARFGYHMPVTEDERERRSAVREWGAQVGAEEATALCGQGDGNGTAGCYREADTVLSADVPEADTDWLTEQGAATLRPSAVSSSTTRRCSVPSAPTRAPTWRTYAKYWRSGTRRGPSRRSGLERCLVTPCAVAGAPAAAHGSCPWCGRTHVDQS